MSEPVEPRFEAYLRANRAFMGPVVEQAITTLDLSKASRILDVGTGAGGALAPLVAASAPDSTVLGVDLHPGVVQLAAEHADTAGVSSSVTLRPADVTDVLAESADAGGTFDAIWAGEVVWPGNFDDPAALVRHMAAALVPGGVLALFYSNYYQAMFLPGHSRLERQLRTASELRWGLPAEGPTHNERHVAWLLAAGLRDVSLRVLPRIGFPIDDDPTVRAYLESVVLPELLTSVTSHGRQAGMSTSEITHAQALLTLDSPDCVLHDPGHYIVHPAILAVGHR